MPHRTPTEKQKTSNKPYDVHESRNRATAEYFKAYEKSHLACKAKEDGKVTHALSQKRGALKLVSRAIGFYESARSAQLLNSPTGRVVESPILEELYNCDVVATTLIKLNLAVEFPETSDVYQETHEDFQLVDQKNKANLEFLERNESTLSDLHNEQLKFAKDNATFALYCRINLNNQYLTNCQDGQNSYATLDRLIHELEELQPQNAEEHNWLHHSLAALQAARAGCARTLAHRALGGSALQETYFGAAIELYEAALDSYKKIDFTTYNGADYSEQVREKLADVQQSLETSHKKTNQRTSLTVDTTFPCESEEISSLDSLLKACEHAIYSDKGYDSFVSGSSDLPPDHPHYKRRRLSRELQSSVGSNSSACSFWSMPTPTEPLAQSIRSLHSFGVGQGNQR